MIMLVVLFSWLVIGMAAFIFGKAIVDRVYLDDLQTMGKLDIYMVAGIIFLNVYAQFFSLFYKLGGIACTILGVIGIALVVVEAVRYRRRMRGSVSAQPVDSQPMSDFSCAAPGSLRQFFAAHKWQVLAAFLCLLLTLVWTNRKPWHYDTGLYHAQAIRWIEEYGVVKGLGNLQMRLAYNSAFMSLQALFSFVWLVGQSLHTLNGFFSFAGLTYAFTTLKKNGEPLWWNTANLLRAAMVIYIVMERDNISSCGTDLLSMLLLLYISIKWCEARESESLTMQCFCCVAAVYAVTVKLSAAVLVLLVIYPAVLLIRRREFRKIIGNLFAGILIALPFLIRNVIISGYLIYPYAELDLFSVDWKMDEAVLQMDRQDITMFGRGITNAAEYGQTFSEWFPHWFLAKSAGEKIMIVFGTLAAVTVCCFLVQSLRRRRYDKAVFMAVSLGGLLFWFASAPLMRYGQVYFMILLSVALGEWKWLPKEKCLGVLMPVLLLLSGVLYLEKAGTLAEYKGADWISQPTYLAWQASQYDVDGEYIWLPDDGDQVGYAAFPNTSSAQQLKCLRLRGTSLKDGFYHDEKRELRKVGE
jgi:hypothetical protein